MRPTRLRAPRVALVGRTNVGKSTLWNRLTTTTQALTSNQPHTTRDRHYGQVVWRGETIELLDTGGVDVEQGFIGEQILNQTRIAVNESDLVLFIVDVQTGFTPDDLLLAKELRASKKEIWLVLNKCDKARDLRAAEDGTWKRLGFGEGVPVSATTSLGIGELLDKVFDHFTETELAPAPLEQENALRIALIGRPNVGKSSLTNAILHEERVIVSPIPHTTREPQDTHFTYKDKEIVLIDTAGMRKRSKIDSRLEAAGIKRNQEAIKSADVTFLVFDATEDPTAQDRHLAGVMAEESKGLILVANKWDLVENKTPRSAKEYEFLLRQSLPFLSWAPMIFTSAVKGVRVNELLDLAIRVQEERHRHIEYNAINKLLKTCIKSMKPIANYGPKSPRIYDVAQTNVAPPTFVITVLGEKESIHTNWTKFFLKRLREKFGFAGTPIVVQVKNVPVAKSARKWNRMGPGMEAVAGKIVEKPRLVNQTRRRQKWG